jgi:hypothetical protein
MEKLVIRDRLLRDIINSQDLSAQPDAGLVDLVSALQPTDEINFTGLELAQILGVPCPEGGFPDITEFANACLHVQTNPAVLQLPDAQRIRVIRSSADALSVILGG